MKKVLFYTLMIVLFSGFIISDQSGHKIITKSFIQGERLEYRVHYGFMNAGEAVVQVHPELYVINNKVCYKATCFGKSVGAFELVTKIRDTWGSYLDTSDLNPQRSYRDITEGRHKLKEGVYYYHQKGVADAEREKRGKTTKYTYSIPNGVQDIVSGFYFLRKFDYNKMRVGDTIKLNAFFEDQLYDFKIKYLGKHKVNTKFGTIHAIKLTPIMPKNDLFSGENSIRVWLSDDLNKIAVKMEADMFVGAVEIDLKGYQGLKHPISFTKD
ncbi:MAG: DUF3108 domain-containing protein [Cytophagaceae bacterium]|nr:DUF3108 domain-containing protein [Cytophagaceae bacterium]